MERAWLAWTSVAKARGVVIRGGWREAHGWGSAGRWGTFPQGAPRLVAGAALGSSRGPQPPQAATQGPSAFLLLPTPTLEGPTWGRE